MLCTSSVLADQLHYYLAYFEHQDQKGSLEITLNNGVPQLVTPTIRLSVGTSPHFDYIPPPLTIPQSKLITWLAQILAVLRDDHAECKILIDYDWMRGSEPYIVTFKPHLGHGARSVRRGL